MIERKYFPINESLARTANDVSSFSEYQEGSATHAYEKHVNSVYDIVDRIAEKKPEYLEKATYMAERYSKKLATYYNDYYRNEASCPSVMISGPANFPARKKEKQNARRDTLYGDWCYLEKYAEKIENMLTCKGPILSNDEMAIEKLTDKLENLKQAQEQMKAVNAYYRKNQTLDGCPDLSDKERKAIEENWERGWYVGKPFPPYALSNNNQNIHATEARLKKLKEEKEAGTREKEYEGFTVKENTDNMRLQFLFDGKPDEDIRNVLKSNGFRWAPSEGAWQRQLTNNARYSAKRVIEAITKTHKNLDRNTEEIV